MNRLAIFGNFAIDDLVFADGTTRWGTPGGSAVYAALGAAMWSQPVAIIAPLGADFPHELLTSIDCTQCRTISHTMRNWGLYEDDGTRHFVSRSRDRNWLSFCADVTELSADICAAHIAPMPIERALQLAQALRASGTSLISADTDDHDLLGNDAAIIELLRAVDLFLPSEQDIQRLWPGENTESALRRLRELSPETKLIAIKRGPNGALAHDHREASFCSVPSLAREVVDTTGAGDAFCGGVLAGYLQNKTPLQALTQGSTSAARCIEEEGFAGLLRLTTTERPIDC